MLTFCSHYGKETQATAKGAVTMGWVRSSGHFIHESNSFQGNVAMGNYSLALGTVSVWNFNNNLTRFENNTARGWNSVAMGEENIAWREWSLVGGLVSGLKSSMI
jgi:hypothetical protein